MAETKTAVPELLGAKMRRFSKTDWIIMVQMVDAIARATGKGGIKIVKAQGGWVFESARTPFANGSLGMVYTQEFDQLSLGSSDDPYLAGDVTRVSGDNDASSLMGGPTVPGVYICIKDNPTSDDYPKHPLQEGGEVIYWDWLSTWPSEEIKCVEGTPTTFLSDSQAKPDEGE